MAKIKWNVAELIERRDKLQALLQTKQTRTAKRKIKISIICYNSLLEEYSVGKSRPIGLILGKEEDDHFSKYIMDYIESILSWDYPKISPYLINIVTNSIEQFYALNDRGHKYQAEPCIMTNTELIEIVDGIFKSINVPSFYRDFQDVIDPRKSFLDIEYFGGRNSLVYDGIAFIDHYNHLAYGKIMRGNTYLDITTTVHEIFHMIISRKIENMHFYGKGRVYSEVDGYLGSFISSEYLYERGIRSGLYIDNGEHHTVKEATLKLAVFAYIAESCYKTEGFTFKNIKDIFAQKNIPLAISRKSLHKYIPFDIEEMITFSLSYLIALDIYEVYKQDPERAIYLLHKVNRLDGKDTLHDLDKLGFTFHEDGYKNLVEKGQLINRRLKTKKITH